MAANRPQNRHLRHCPPARAARRHAIGCRKNFTQKPCAAIARRIHFAMQKTGLGILAGFFRSILGDRDTGKKITEMVGLSAEYPDFDIHLFNFLDYNKGIDRDYQVEPKTVNRIKESISIVTKQHSASAVLDVIERCLDETKAEDVVVINLSGKSSIADYMVVASGASQRQLGAIADRISRAVDPVKVEGVPGCDWVCVDTGDVLVHLFKPEARGFYNIEKMWGAELPMQPSPAMV